MATLSQLLERLQSINIAKEFEEAFNQQAYYAEDLNVMQLMEGMGGDGPMPYYSDESVTRYGKPYGRIRLYETGDFYKGITYKAEGDTIKAFSTDKKNDYLEEFYMEYAPVKLTDESKKDMASMVQSKMAENIGNKTGLK
jgi:hypothetical protein